MRPLSRPRHFPVVMLTFIQYVFEIISAPWVIIMLFSQSSVPKNSSEWYHNWMVLIIASFFKLEMFSSVFCSWSSVAFLDIVFHLFFVLFLLLFHLYFCYPVCWDHWVYRWFLCLFPCVRHYAFHPCASTNSVFHDVPGNSSRVICNDCILKLIEYSQRIPFHQF